MRARMRTGNGKRPGRMVPLPYDDGFRSAIAATVASVIAIGGAVLLKVLSPDERMIVVLFAGLCLLLTCNALVYIIWTHRLFARGDSADVRRIAAIQERRGPSLMARWLGFARAEDWAVTSALSALIAALAASVIGARDLDLWQPALVIVTAGTAWATMVYAFALRYFRLSAGGERIEFDIEEEPEFIDFVSMAVMISAVGALSGGTPRTRAALSAVRTHTYIAFGFNALVVAMVVSLVSGFITAA